ncbi:hypothetical protein D3C87_1220670 [compost metagenome]
MRDRSAETQDEQAGRQRREDIGDGRGGVGQMHAEAFDQAWIIQRLAERGEAADQPQRPERLMTEDVQCTMAVRAVEQGKRNHADRRETGADHQRIGQHHCQAFT